MALATGAPVIPVAMIDTEKIQPPGKVVPKLMRPGIRIGKPLDFSRYHGMEGDRFILRSVTDEVMYEIMKLSGQEYVDIYATAAKRQIAEREGGGGEGREGGGEGGKAGEDGNARPRSRVVRPGVGDMAKRERVVRMSVEQPLWRALTALPRTDHDLRGAPRSSSRHDKFERPWVAVAFLAVMALWTLVTLPKVANAAPLHQTLPRSPTSPSR